MDRVNGDVSSNETGADEIPVARHEGRIIRGNPTGTKLFLVEEAEKRWVRTPEVLDRLGFAFGDVVVLSDEEVDLIPTGEPIDLSDPRFGGPRFDLAAGRYRSLAFREQSGSRFGWFRVCGTFVPLLFSFLSDEEWDVVEAWYNDTQSRNFIGESNVAFMSALQGFVMGSAMAPIVELGLCAGFSTLLLGFMLRHMGKENALFSVELDDFSVDYVGRWIRRAGLEKQVRVHQGDSASEAVRHAALAHFGRSPRAIVIDSSHQYAHTLAELDSWFPILQPNGFVFLHDANDAVQHLDPTGQGGVSRAMAEWTAAHPEAFAIRIGPDPDQEEEVYVDTCGLGIIQKHAKIRGPGPRPGRT